MTDFASFKHGGVTFPVPAPGTRTALRDLDPALFYMLEFYGNVIETHIGARFVSEATQAEANHVTRACATLLPLNPEPFLAEEHLEFPVLAAVRKSTTYEYMGQRKLAVDTIEVSYILPPFRREEAEAMLPFLKSVRDIIDNRTEQGFDPAYTPSEPPGVAGELVWKADRAGIARVEVTGAQMGGYTPLADLFFPAVVLTVIVKERSEAVIAELAQFLGADMQAQIADQTGEVIETIADMESIPAPTLVGPLSPSTGSKAGGTPVTIPCTGLVVGRTYRVLFAGADAASVVAVSTTSLQCVTPQVDAYPTKAADVLVIDQDRQLSNALLGAFSFTSP